jgi:hypothetical protein
VPHDRLDQTAGLAEALSVISRRLWISAILRASAVALPLGAVAWMVLTRAGLTAAIAALLVVVVTMGIAAAWLTSIGSRWTAKAAAGALEVAHPSSRNVVITAEELLRHPERPRRRLTSRRIARASRSLRRGRVRVARCADHGRPAARCAGGDSGRR